MVEWKNLRQMLYVVWLWRSCEADHVRALKMLCKKTFRRFQDRSILIKEEELIDLVYWVFEGSITLTHWMWVEMQQPQLGSPKLQTISMKKMFHLWTLIKKRITNAHLKTKKATYTDNLQVALLKTVGEKQSKEWFQAQACSAIDT